MSARRGGDEGPHAGRFEGNGPRMRGEGNFADSGRHRGDNGDWHGDRRHSANRDHDNDRHHGERHRVFRNGAWVWVYGPDIYAYGGDCSWLLHRARITDSPYWWRRYEECVY
jgi:hypothetical protein